MITAIITLSLFLFASLVFNVFGGRAYNSLFIENKTLNWKLRCHINATNDCAASYHVRRIECEGHEHNGKWSVARLSINDGLLVHTVIKVFTDADDDFNHREAEELCEMLNSK